MSQSPCVGLSAASRALGRDRHCNSFLPQRGLASEVLHPHVSGLLLLGPPSRKHGPQIRLRPWSPRRVALLLAPPRGSARGSALLLSLPVWGAGTRRGLLPSSPLSPRAAREEPPERRRLLTRLLKPVDDRVNQRRRTGQKTRAGRPVGRPCLCFSYLTRSATDVCPLLP